MDQESSNPQQRPRPVSGDGHPGAPASRPSTPVASASTRFRSLSDPDSLREFAKNIREGIYITTRDGEILDANQAFLEIAGVGSIAELGTAGAVAMYADPERRKEQVRLLEADGSVREYEITLRRPDGQARTVLDTCHFVRDPDTGETFIHGILIDITARKALEASLLEMSTHDPLTGALNRRCLADVEAELARDPASKCGCIFVDIDHFKLYNDRWGHQEGDEVLRRMARFLMRYVRAEEVVVRIGGDEFIILLRGRDADSTKVVADRLRIEALERAPVPFSLGWATREAGEPLIQLLDRADQSLMAVRVIKRQTDPRQQAAIPARP